jgi:2-dehydro-3-deoxyphosphooctonate aldolase (KDO 8-P synthase)
MNLKFIIGPCVIEDEQFTLDLAKKIQKITSNFNRLDIYFKASFDKANRTSINSFRGVGIEEGKRILLRVKNEIDLKTITDIHESYQADIIKEAVDIIQIPAFLARQTDLLIAAAKTGKIVNVKKGQFMAPWDMKNVVKKLEESGNHNIMLTERGSSFGYNNLIVDMTSIKEMKKFGYPVIFDATHSVQKPGGLGDKTGGNREYIETLAYAAIAAGADGIFVEVHPNPDKALSDGPNSLKLDRLEAFIKNIILIKESYEKIKSNS